LSQITPFRIDVPQAQLDDLRERLGRSLWPDELPGAGWSQGIPAADVRALAEYWRTGYDWRAHEARINELPQFTTTIDGQNVHFVHVRSPEPDAVPLLLTHGWPSSVVEYLDMIGPLTDPRAHGGDPEDAFDVVIPSIPGFGLSGPTTEAGWGRDRVARALAELMTRLGYERFVAQGGDFGALVSRELGIRNPERVIGAHVLQVFAFPSGDPEEMAKLTPDDYAKLEVLGRWEKAYSGYTEMQSRRPQTLAFGLADSPAGLLAWIGDMFEGYGENVGAVDRDALLTNLTIYWTTRTIASSMRFYYDDAQAGAWERGEASVVPTGVAVFPRDFRSIRVFAERANRIVHWTEMERGGHFGAIEAPGALVADLRAFVRGVI
jgi:pimeloyl-ACP methyl ester carboxylesterase